MLNRTASNTFHYVMTTKTSYENIHVTTASLAVGAGAQHQHQLMQKNRLDKHNYDSKLLIKKLLKYLIVYTEVERLWYEKLVAFEFSSNQAVRVDFALVLITYHKKPKTSTA